MADGERALILSEIKSISKPDFRTPEFILPMPEGTTYRFFSDFSNPRAASLMKKYLDSAKELDSMESRLFLLRRNYTKGSSNSGSAEIMSLERQVETKEMELKSIKSDIYKYELQNN